MRLSIKISRSEANRDHYTAPRFASPNQTVGTTGRIPAAEARLIVKGLEFHHTPKHASWLNMAEMEFSVLARACLRGRNADAVALTPAISAYVAHRNAARATINWRFSTQDARTKLRRLYPFNSRID